ncbi:MAG: pentapeptide repeat-containing protein, partial [bacterium]
LEGANLKDAYLKSANLINAKFCHEYKSGEWQKGEVDFREENEGRFANLDKANLKNARLQKAKLDGASLKEANMNGSCLQGATLIYAELEKASLLKVGFQDSVLEDANIKGAEIARCNLRRANFRMAKVDNDTSLWKPEINRCYKAWDPETSSKGGKHEYTDFQGVPLNSIRTDPSSKQLLEYNIRRTNWEQWYKYKDWQGQCKDERHIVIQKLMWFIRKFWEISDYGISTKRIMWTFGKWAIVYALIYYTWGFIDYYFMSVKDYPGIVSDLFVLEDNQEAVSCWLVPFRAIYFSIVTMTTLGFGDMYANAHSFLRGLFGHALLALQVILGYVLLGALVTRFAVLFTAGGPAGRFANEEKKEDKTY